MNQLEDVVVPIAIFGSFAYMFRIWLEYKTRKLLVEKGLVDEKVKFLYHQAADAQIPSSLKWGMVLIAMGLAIFVAQQVAYNEEEYVIAFMALFGGIAMLVYHFLAMRWIKSNR
jgi:hypothetical protein